MKETHINYIKDVVYKYQLHTDDLLQRMNLNRDHPPLDLYKLKEALKSLDESLNQIKALKLAKDILDGKDQITIQELVNLFDTVEEDDKCYDASWFKDTLHRLRNHLFQHDKFDKLVQSFEFFDEHQEGTLDTANFKTVIMENNLGLSVQDINRLVRYIPKTKNNLINYYDFLKMIDDVNKRADQNELAKDLTDFAQKLARFMKGKRQNAVQFLQLVRISQASTSIDAIASYVHKNIFSANSLNQCHEFCKEMDIDGNGLITDDDLTAFTTRYTYFDQRTVNNRMDNIIESVIRSQANVKNVDNDALSMVEKSFINSKSIDLLTIGQHKPFQTLVDSMKDTQLKNLHPLQPMKEDKFDAILRDIRTKLSLKGMSYEEMFHLLDSEHKGFITVTDFAENVDKILNLSKPAKDGFFAYMDKQKIGLIDLNTFLKYISKSIIQKMPKLQEDDWDWELEILFKIRNWRQRQNLTIEDAFRTFDKDFDGEISKGDIKTFILDILKIEEKEVSEAKLNRLFKLMDQYKRGRITLMDFRRFIEEGFFYGGNQQIFGGGSQTAQQQMDIRSSFDWKSNARQQIGLVISRRFSGVKESFDMVSGYRKKLVFQKFKSWIDELNVLSGFDLTEKLVYELFSDLDVHRKGYLSEVDWTNAFGDYNWEEQMIKEVRDALKTNFEGIEEGVKFFKNGHKVITKESFMKAIECLFPKRYMEQDINGLWNRISKNSKNSKNGQMSSQEFQEIFELKGRIYNKVDEQDVGLDRHQMNIDLLDRIRRYLRNSNKDITVMFREYDKSDVGKITNMEFRSVFRNLNMGLTFQEIDMLCTLCLVDHDSMVDWKEFSSRLSLRQADVKILDRAAIHIHRVNDHIYHYLISPKDAFRQFDHSHNGVLTFDTFRELIEALYNLANEDIPQFAIIKDLFQFIDKRRDGAIDLTEWMDAFSKFTNPTHAIKNKRPLTANQFTKQSHRFKPNKTILSATDKKPQQHLATSPINKYFQGIQNHDGLINAQNNFKNFLRKTHSQHNHALTYQDNGVWESSKEFDKILIAIGKNRKYLMDIFRQISRNDTAPIEEDVQPPLLIYKIKTQVIKQEIDRMLRSQGLFVNEQQWPCLINWAKRNSVIDYKFLLQVYKDRLNGMDQQPRLN